jgi:hypothetical protein
MRQRSGIRQIIDSYNFKIRALRIIQYAFQYRPANTSKTIDADLRCHFYKTTFLGKLIENIRVELLEDSKTTGKLNHSETRRSMQNL